MVQEIIRLGKDQEFTERHDLPPRCRSHDKARTVTKDNIPSVPSHYHQLGPVLWVLCPQEDEREKTGPGTMVLV